MGGIQADSGLGVTWQESFRMKIMKKWSEQDFSLVAQ
jgi:hypothetical protein